MRPETRAAAGHLVVAAVGLAALLIGAAWVGAAGDATAVPPTLIVLSLVVLTPLAVDHSWAGRGEFLDRQVEATCRFLTTIGLTATAIIGFPALISWALPTGTELWSSLLVLPYLGAIAIPVAWAFFAIRAALLAARGVTTPYPEWATPGRLLVD